MNLSPLWQSLTARIGKDQDETVEMFKKIPVFEGLSDRNLRRIRSLCHVRHYQQGELVFRSGEPGAGMYLILDGGIEIFRDEEDFYQEYAILYPGDFFGEIALLDDLPRTASARARSYSTLLGFYRPDLIGLLSRNPQLAGDILLNIARLIGRRLVNTNLEMEKLHLRNMELEKRKSSILEQSGARRKPQE